MVQTPSYKGAAIGGSEPLQTYVAGTGTFTFNSNDLAIIGDTEEFGLTVTFADYPPTTGADSVDATGEITYIDPCNNPFTFSESQVDAEEATDAYSNTAVTFDGGALFSITPP